MLTVEKIKQEAEIAPFLKQKTSVAICCYRIRPRFKRLYEKYSSWLIVFYASWTDFWWSKLTSAVAQYNKTILDLRLALGSSITTRFK